ncbi:MAG: hypothetical protein IT536_12540 [Hyphomicrobiales bacterium]|nr:hypothetical protein [Hyphomicrobiales bacterium]
MRASLAEASADRVSSTITWLAWGLAGAFFIFVAPLAFSSPYPEPSRPDWAVQTPVATALASASSFSLAAASTSVEPDAESVPLVRAVRTLSIRRPIGDAPEPEAEATIVTASLGGLPDREGAYGPSPAAAPAADEAAPASQPSAAPGSAPDIDQYLWEVYQRQPMKRDRGGDFSWKDPAAANRMGKTLQAYVIAGMDADFREQLYHAGKAMDEAGIEWTIVSGFRDDWRQSIASGLKARTGFSRHGGSRSVGGYGHGRAVDVGHIDSAKSHIVYRWIDANGAKFGLHRPYRFDPPHVEPRLDWRRLAAALRRERTGVAAVAAAHEPVEQARPARRSARVVRASTRAARGRPASERKARKS